MINRTKMPRQLRNKGGITSVSSRKKYGIGSDIKDFVRDIIPNELADVAVKVAPIVAPFYPGYAAIARGLGRFDQRGSISDALKQGAATYVGGRGVRALAGAEGAAGGFDTFSKKGFQERGLGRLFQKKQGVLTEDQMKRKRLSDLKNADSIKDTPEFMKTATDATIGKVPLLNKLPDMVQQKLLVGGITSGASALYSYFTGEFEPQKPGETMGEYMARRNQRVKEQMRGYMDSYYTPLRNPQYAAMSDEEKNNFIDGIVGEQNDAMMATGGRVGYQVGGISSANTLAENIARNRAAQSAFQQSIAPAQQKTRQKITQRLEDFGNKLTGIVEGARDYTVPVVQGARAFLTGAGEPIITDSMRRDLIERAQAKGGDSGFLGYEDYGLTPAGNISGGRFGGGITDIINDPQAFANAATLGRVTFNRDPKTGEYSFGDTKYDFTPDPDTGSTGSALLDFINEGGVKAKVSDLLTPSTAMAAETTPTPDAGLQAAYEDFLGIGPGQKYQLRGNEISLEDFRKNVYEPNQKQYQTPDRPTMTDVAGPATTGAGYAGDTKNVVSEDPLGLIQQINKLRNGQLPTANYSYQPEEGGYVAWDGTSYTVVSPDQIKMDIEALQAQGLKEGGMPTGIMRSNQAGVMERDYRDKGGFVPVGIKEKADDVPAMLSKNEFVFTADAVRGAGNGSIEKGAQKMYDTMKNLERRVV